MTIGKSTLRSVVSLTVVVVPTKPHCCAHALLHRAGQSRPGGAFNGRVPVVIEPAGVFRLSQSVPIVTLARRSCGDGVGMRCAEAAAR